MNFFKIISIFFLLLLGIGYYAFESKLNSSINHNTFFVLSIEKGDTLSEVIKKMHDNSIIEYPKILLLYAKVTNLETIKPGEFEFSAGTSHKSFLKTINLGTVKSHPLTVVEGWTFKQALDAIESNMVLSQTEQRWQTTIDILGYSQYSSDKEYYFNNYEGLIFPDTYFIEKGQSKTEFLMRSHRRLVDILNREWMNRADDLPYKNPYEALIMASIIEKETAVADERKEISGVFVRRLKIGMRLQTDPTIIYGLGNSYQGDIKRRHIKQRTDYNTYIINGLPPTPIALVGRESIHAALNPKQGDSLYFVAKGNGYHHFSSSLEEHNEAVKKYQLK